MYEIFSRELFSYANFFRTNLIPRTFFARTKFHELLARYRETSQLKCFLSTLFLFQLFFEVLLRPEYSIISLLRNRIYYSCLLIFERRFKSCFDINKICRISWLQNFLHHLRLYLQNYSNQVINRLSWMKKREKLEILLVSVRWKKVYIYIILWDTQLEVQVI